jgi:hypothetical protein
LARRCAAAAAAAAFLTVSFVAPLPVSYAAMVDGSEAAFSENSQRLRADPAADPVIHLTAAEIAEMTSATVAPSSAEYSLSDFLFRGVINWGGHKFTFYSEQVLPGGGLAIPGRHLNAGGYVSDSDGYIVLAGSAPLGTVFETPFGYQGKIYDRGTVGNHLDVYIR